MLRSAAVVAGAWLAAWIPVAAAAQELAPPPVRAVHITGARELSTKDIEESLRVRVGEPLPDTPDRIADSVRRQYRDEGYTFARVTSSFDPTSGALSLDIDEGVIDAVVFQGVDEQLAQTFAADFALRAGDVFNNRRARQALDVLLRPTRG